MAQQSVYNHQERQVLLQERNQIQREIHLLYQNKAPASEIEKKTATLEAIDRKLFPRANWED